MPKFLALIAALAVAAALTGCPTETDRPGDENGGNQHIFYRTPNTVALSGLEGGKSVYIEDRTLLGTRPVGTLGLVTPEIADGVRDAINAVIAGGDERALCVLARGIRIIAVDTAGPPVAGKTELSVYIGWLRADALADALLAEIVGEMYGLGSRPGECDGDACACEGEGCGKEGCECEPPVTGPGKCDGDACDCGGGEECGKPGCACYVPEENCPGDACTCGGAGCDKENCECKTPQWVPPAPHPMEMQGRTLHIKDHTGLGQSVDFVGLVTQDILAKIETAIRLQEEMGDPFAAAQWNAVLDRGLRVIIVNEQANYNQAKVTWNTLSLHIDNVSAWTVDFLRQVFDGQVRQFIFPIPEQQAGGATVTVTDFF